MSRILGLPHIFKTDAAESAFILRELEHLRSKVYETEYPENRARALLPTLNEGDGADFISVETTDSFGSAKIISDYADDLPRADTKSSLDSQKVRDLGTSYGVSLQEMRRAARVGKPLKERKAKAARKAIEDLIDQIAFFGDAKYDLKGFANHPQLTVGSAAQTIAASDDEELMAMVNGMIAFISDVTKGVHKPDTLVLPEAQHTILTTRRLSNSDMTVWKFLQQSQPWIKRVEAAYKLKGAGAAGADRMIAFKADPDHMYLSIPHEFEQLPEEREGLEWKTACIATTGGVIVQNATTMYALDGI